MEFQFLLVTKYFRNSGFGTIFTKQDVEVKKVVSSHPYPKPHKHPTVPHPPLHPHEHTLGAYITGKGRVEPSFAR